MHNITVGQYVLPIPFSHAYLGHLGFTPEFIGDCMQFTDIEKVERIIPIQDANPKVAGPNTLGYLAGFACGMLVPLGLCRLATLEDLEAKFKEWGLAIGTDYDAATLFEAIDKKDKNPRVASESFYHELVAQCHDDAFSATSEIINREQVNALVHLEQSRERFLGKLAQRKQQGDTVVYGDAQTVLQDFMDQTFQGVKKDAVDERGFIPETNPGSDEEYQSILDYAKISDSANEPVFFDIHTYPEQAETGSTEQGTTLEPGDVVCLKSGGPEMTLGKEQKDSGYYEALWFEHKTVKNGYFLLEQLEKK